MNLLGMFAKHWTPGEVKSRLAASIGDVAASQLYLACLQTLLARFATLANRRVLAYSPADREQEFAQISGDAWRLVPQTEGDLGQRMAAFFREAFGASAKKVVLIGSDSPTLPHSILEDAFTALDQASVVIGPASDGGYYLVGAAERPPPIFEGIGWSTAGVFRQTAACLEGHGIAYHVLPEWYDIDTLTDLHRLRHELASLPIDDSCWAVLRALVRLRLLPP